MYLEPEKQILHMNFVLQGIEDSESQLDSVDETSQSTTSVDEASLPSSSEALPNKVPLKITPLKRYKKSGATNTDKALEELKLISQTLNQPQPEDNEFDCFGRCCMPAKETSGILSSRSHGLHTELFSTAKTQSLSTNYYVCV